MPKVSLNELSKIESTFVRSGKIPVRTIIAAPKNHVADSFARGCEILHETNPKQSSGSTIGERLFGIGSLSNRPNASVKVNKGNSLEVAKTAAQKITKQAKEYVSSIKTMIEDALDAHGISHDVKFMIRPKSEEGSTTKTVKETLKTFKQIQKAIQSVQNPENVKFEISEILPAISQKTPQKTIQIIKDVQSLLTPQAKEGIITLAQAREALSKDFFKANYGKDGLKIFEKIQTKIQKIHTEKVKEAFDSISYSRESLKDISKSVRDAIGIRFVISKPAAKKINSLPVGKRQEAFEHYMAKKADQLTALIGESTEITDAQIIRVMTYGNKETPIAKTTYLSSKNVQQLQMASENVRVQEAFLPNGYVTSQGNLTMLTEDKNLPLRLEFQIRGEEVNKISEVEHFPYDVREGKKTDLSKYPKKEQQLITKIQEEAKKLVKDTKLNSKYDEYLKQCYIRAFASEHGVELPVPQLPKGLNDVLSIESLLTLYHQ